jgi:DsbC/DsbD-like thiol-disulfide interchange protein
MTLKNACPYFKGPIVLQVIPTVFAESPTVMKKLVMVTLAVTGFLLAAAQNPVSWQYTATKKADKTYEVKITATIGPGWHVYSQTTPEGGPLPTRIVFNKNPLLTLEGGVKEVGKLESRFEEVFGIDTKFYSGKVEFVQTVKLKSAARTNIGGSVEFMVCNDNQCLPPSTLNFSVLLK